MQNGQSAVKTEMSVKTESKTEVDDTTVHTDDYNALVKYGISKNVAAELEKIYATGEE